MTHVRAHHTDAVPAQVDVLIVGCGPAGLTLAAQLAAFPDISVAIVEQKDGPLQLGQADGIACRTMEMFEAFNFSERVLKESCWINEVTFWKPDEKSPDRIVRHGRVQDTEDGLSEFPHVILNQARVHDFYLELMRNSPSRLEPHYARKLLDVVVDRNATDYPVTVRLERTDAAHAGKGAAAVETVRARYVVGCDGARSAVRKSMGRELVGDAAQQAWGVMDVLAVTDFPDIRHKVAIQSNNGGNLMIIPREGGYLVRMYVEMDKLGDEERGRAAVEIAAAKVVAVEVIATAAVTVAIARRVGQHQLLQAGEDDLDRVLRGQGHVGRLVAHGRLGADKQRAAHDAVADVEFVDMGEGADLGDVQPHVHGGHAQQLGRLGHEMHPAENYGLGRSLAAKLRQPVGIPHQVAHAVNNLRHLVDVRADHGVLFFFLAHSTRPNFSSLILYSLK